MRFYSVKIDFIKAEFIFEIDFLISCLFQLEVDLASVDFIQCGHMGLV